jgi:RNA polymerase sigma-70 factor (ECF subfamily)
MPNDAELMQRVCGGDEEAFAAIVERYKNPLVNYLTHLVRSRERAEDVAQEAFVRLYRNAERYRDTEKLAPYLFRIATNHTISEMRREKRWRLLMPRLVAGSPSVAPPADTALMSDEVQRKVAAALEQLPIKFRAPLALYEIEEWSYDDIARALGCRMGTIKSRIARARELMRRQLAGWWIGGKDHDERHRDRQRDQATAAHERVATLHL